jgi:hypothetical protein
MKLSPLTLCIAGAAIAQTGLAAPVRVIVFSGSGFSGGNVATSNVRYGHALNPKIAGILPPPVPIQHHGANIHLFHPNNDNNNHEDAQRIRQHGPCAGGMKSKAIQIANKFRGAVGLPLISLTPVSPQSEKDEEMKLKSEFSVLGSESLNRPMDHHRHHHHGPGRFHRLEDQPFMNRLYFALRALGPWEGRAVAFVLGCGLGVLIRMFWVLTVVTYRLVKGSPSAPEDEGYDAVYAEELFVAPPLYTYADETNGNVQVAHARDEKKDAEEIA